ncbi:MAG: response regulator [bacterium]|nr:response regulator [bacterium]
METSYSEAGIKLPEPHPLILIVDDVPKNLQVLGAILRKEEYKIAPATSGVQALNMLKEIQPDLILLDVMMPDMDGFEVCAKLKESKATRELPIIFLTAKTETEDIVKGFSIGAMDYVTKPFNSAELLSRVHTHISLKRSRDRERDLIGKLREALTKVKLLSGLLPMCFHCKKIRDDKGYWQQVEEYIGEHSEAHFSHSLCPQCVRKLYPDMADRILAE